LISFSFGKKKPLPSVFRERVKERVLWSRVVPVLSLFTS
jgi:hypothetical protein